MDKRFTVDLAIFPQNAVQFCVQAFSGVCGMSVLQAETTAVCIFDCGDSEFDEISNEFGNYLIYAANKRGMSAC